MTFRRVLLGGVAFVAFRGIAKRAIKKVTDQPDEFLLLVEVHGRVSKAASAQVFELALLGQNQSPRDLFKGNALGETLLAEFVVAGLNGLIGLLPKPEAKVVVNLITTIVEVIVGELVIRTVRELLCNFLTVPCVNSSALVSMVLINLSDRCLF
jgi:hypothetical protein